MKNEIEAMLTDACGPRIDTPRGLTLEAECYRWSESSWLIHETEWCEILGMKIGWHVVPTEDDGWYALVVRTTHDAPEDSAPLALANTVEDVAAMVAEATECLRKFNMLPTPTTEAN